MTTSKGTIQGYNGVATVDKKHQIVIDAQAFGSGQEHHTLPLIIDSIQSCYQRTGMNDALFDTGLIVTADTGFANEANMKILHDKNINAYIPDQHFRSRDPKFKDHKKKHPRPTRAKGGKALSLFRAQQFDFDPMAKTCRCPAGEMLSPRAHREDNRGRYRAHFVGRITQCRACELKTKCLKNPEKLTHTDSQGRQVSFLLNEQRKPNYTDWMKHRVDSDKGKRIYSHRMSVVEPVFGNLTVNKRLRRFSLRSRVKVNAQWKLFCMIQNIEKLANYGDLAA